MTFVRSVSRICRLCSKADRNLLSRGVGTSSLKNTEGGIGDLKENPYFDKYAKKISELQKESPDELLTRLETFRRLRGKSKSRIDASGQPTLTKEKSLDDVVKLELLAKKSAKEIKEIWLDFHSQSSDAVAAVITKDTFDVMVKKSVGHPTFLLPLPRSKGYEYIVCQFSGREVHFTPLLNYQTFKENAPECLALTHFTELQDSKGLVLIRGEFNKDVLSISEATCLMNQLQRYYGEEDERRERLLERFTHSPMEFRHMDLIVELERLAF